MARVLIVEGADRGLRLASALVDEDHAVRVVTSDPALRPQIDALGAECFAGDPSRLATLSGALEHVTIVCWLLADADRDPRLLEELHGPRLERFVDACIDSTVRGFLYEAGSGLAGGGPLAEGALIVSETARRNSIPVACLTSDHDEPDAWLEQALAHVHALLSGSPGDL